MNDLSVDKFAYILQMLDPWPCVTLELVEESKYHKSQKQHMVGWFYSQSTTGEKGFKRKKANTSSKETYNKLMSAKAMLWIAEALGEQEETLRKAYQAAEDAQKINYRGRCTAFRSVIPWDRIDELLHDPKGWRLDPALKGIIKRVKGWPDIPESKRAEFDQVIRKEFG